LEEQKRHAHKEFVMKWPIAAAAAAFSLAFAAPALASTGQAFSQHTSLRFAQNDDNQHPTHAQKQHRRIVHQTKKIERNRKTLQNQHRRIEHRSQRLSTQHRKIENRNDRLSIQHRRIVNRRQTLHHVNHAIAAHRRYDWNHYRIGHRPEGWREHQFDRHAWERNFYAHRRFHWHAYVRPRGWYYRRWTYGMTFPRAFWARNYWINDYGAFGLENPPYGYVWVRYGSDAVLVNVEDGRILRVVYNLYY
jgi:hypothetical protein